MKSFNTFIFTLCLLGSLTNGSAQINSSLEKFDKIVVGPKINLVLSAGEEASIKIEYDKIEEHRINFKIVGQTLRLYLDDARFVEKSVRNKRNWSWNRSMYAGVEVTAYVTYQQLSSLDVRGEQTVDVLDLIDEPTFNLNLYGESTVNIADILCGIFKANIYGDIRLNIEKGNSVEQTFRLYGDCEVNCANFEGDRVKATCFGDSDISLNPESLKVTAFGEAVISYSGSPDINKGLVIGDVSFRQIR